MSFNSLNKEELQKVADFFVVDVEAADEDKGPTKKELVTALESGDDPVTWEQYKEIYVPAKESESTEPVGADLTATEPTPVEPEPVDDGPKTLIAFTGKNPRFDMAGYTFTKSHPFHSVPEPVADYLVKNGPFRPALASEVADFYN